MRSKSLILLALVSLLLAACAGPTRQEAKEAADLTPTLSLTSYIEDGKLLTIIVGTKVARTRHKEGFMPVELAIANKGLGGITLTKESFRLVDEDGNSYPAVDYRELRDGYPSLDLDRRLGDVRIFANARYDTYREIPSNWTPTFDNGIELPRLHLPRYHWAYDYLYFPAPKTGVRGRKFELHLQANELPHPILIKFKVP